MRRASVTMVEALKGGRKGGKSGKGGRKGKPSEAGAKPRRKVGPTKEEKKAKKRVKDVDNAVGGARAALEEARRLEREESREKSKVAAAKVSKSKKEAKAQQVRPSPFGLCTGEPGEKALSGCAAGGWGAYQRRFHGRGGGHEGAQHQAGGEASQGQGEVCGGGRGIAGLDRAMSSWIAPAWLIGLLVGLMEPWPATCGNLVGG